MMTNRTGRQLALSLMLTLAVATIATATDCEVGNPPPTDAVMPDAFVGGETIALIYTPIHTCPPIQPGFQPVIVHLLMQFDPEDVPITFDLRVRLGWTHTGDPYYDMFWLPCETTAQITCEVPGVQEYTFPLEVTMLCCGHLENPHPPAQNVYAIGVEFPAEFPPDARPSAPVGESDDVLCWIDRGDGWYLAGEYGWTWNQHPLIWAEADYCDQPVAADARSWSSVREQYR